MTTYPIPTGPHLPTFRNIVVERDLAANGWRVNGQLQHTDGRVRHFAAIVKALDVLQDPELWADWLDQARIDHEHLKSKGNTMKYSTEESAVVTYDQLLTFISRIDFADRQTIDALTRRVKTAGMSRALTEMVLDVIDYVHEKGTDE